MPDIMGSSEYVYPGLFSAACSRRGSTARIHAGEGAQGVAQARLALRSVSGAAPGCQIPGWRGEAA